MNKEKKIRKVFSIILIIIVIIIALMAYVTENIKSKVNKIQFTSDFDESQLAINEQLYNEVANNVTQEEFNSIKNIALLGIDEGKSDLIIIASINQSENKIKLITIPRDTYVNVEGYGKIALKEAYSYGQEQLTLNAINSNFGLNISKYASVNFRGFIKFINKVGGIKLNITQAEMNYINENIGENKTKLTDFGEVNLTGEQVITFMRNKNVTKNSEIESRQKRVLMAILNKFSQISAMEIWKSIDYILEEVITNLNNIEDKTLGNDIMNSPNSYIQNVELTQVPFENIGQGQVCDFEAAKEEFKKVIYGN